MKKTILSLLFVMMFALPSQAQDVTQISFYTALNTGDLNHQVLGIRAAGVDDGVGIYGKLGHRTETQSGLNYEGFELLAGPTVALPLSDELNNLVQFDLGGGIVHTHTRVQRPGGPDNQFDVSLIGEANLMVSTGYGHVGFGGRYLDPRNNALADGFEFMFNMGVTF